MDTSKFLKMTGMMPVEFFSFRTNYNDREALEASQNLIAQIGPEWFCQTVSQYLENLFTVKAMTQDMPRFGQDADAIIKGMVKLIIALGNGKQADEIA